MTPSPESVGSGIINIEAENNLLRLKTEINQIFIDARARANQHNNAVIVGFIAEKEKTPSGEVKNYIHPIVQLRDKHSILSPATLEDYALGGENFEHLFPFESNIFNYTSYVEWGGEVGLKKYDNEPEENDDPLTAFFYYDYIDNGGMYYNLGLLSDEIRENMSKELQNEDTEIDKGLVADYLLPKTIDAQTKIKIAQQIIIGLKNASNVKLQPQIR